MIMKILPLLSLVLATTAQEISVGPLGMGSPTQHDVTGDVFIIQDNVLEVRMFGYDGLGPAVSWWIDSNPTPSQTGKSVVSPNNPEPCTITLTGLFADGSQAVRVELPEGETVSDYLGGSLSVWCDAFSTSFGHVVLPSSLANTVFNADVVPQCVDSSPSDASGIEVGSLGMGGPTQHDVTGEVFIINERVLEVRMFGYDGLGPAVSWWIDSNPTPSGSGMSVVSPNNPEQCSIVLTGFFADGSQTVRIELPQDKTINDYLGGSLSVWCDTFSVSFGHVVLPASIDQSLLSAGVATECSEEPSVPTVSITPEGFNCEELTDDLQVRWRVSGDSTEMEIELLGRLEEGNYMAFGRSGSDSRTSMLGGDVVVADASTGVFRARDFFMNARAFCSSNGGVCPDVEQSFTNDISGVTGSAESGLTRIRYTRPLVPSDTMEMSGDFSVDRALTLDGDTFVIWAIGPINQMSDFPAIHTERADPLDALTINFGRPVADNCEPLLGEIEDDEEIIPFERPVLTDTELTAHIGPSGGPRGFGSITGGRTSWGIAWYMNGQLIPELEWRRGTKYTIKVSGGEDPSLPGSYHPMYLTTNEFGGYALLNSTQRQMETIFAGVEFDDGAIAQARDSDNFTPTALGPICLYGGSSAEARAAIEDLSNYDVFLNSLDTSCVNSPEIVDAAGTLEFTPDASTPDVIYYQCVTHPNLGWKIRILDEDDTSASAKLGGIFSSLFFAMVALLL